ncbi:MAG: RNA polymerase sigma factor [Planctomycetes bacterium]|nr:RNA polymerase sigma factor [Planctomycetota bacterium]
MAAWAEQTDRAYMLALRTTGSPALAEEAVQEACVRILQRPPEDRGDEAAAAYFLRTVHGVAVDLTRSSKHRRHREENHGVATEKNTRAPDEIAAARETARAARAALSTLPQEEREAVCLCCEQSLSRSMAAYVLQQPEQTVADRVQRGLEKLRQRLSAQGFAAVTPVLLGKHLAELGVPKAPAALADRVRDLSAAARESVRAARRVAAHKAPGNLGVKVVLGAAVVAAVAVVASGVLDKDAPRAEKPAAKTEAPAETALAIRSEVPPEEVKPVYARWDFAQGLAQDLEVVYGKWNWRAATEEAPGGMEIPEGYVTVVPPTEVPQRPFVLTVMLTWKAKAAGKRRWISGAGWTDGKEKLEFKCWTSPWMGSPAGAYEVRHYYIGRYKYEYAIGSAGTRVTALHEFSQPYPLRRVFLSFTNENLDFTVQSIELKEVKEDEIPAVLRDPEALKKTMSKHKHDGKSDAKSTATESQEKTP